MPWTSGITGIAYDPKNVKRPITKLADLWDPAFKGKVGMFSDTQELGNFGMMALGIDPAKSTPDDWEKAAAKLKEQKSAGIVRKYYDQSYVDALGKRRGLDHPGLVRRHLPEERLRRHGPQVRDPGGGRHDLDRQLRIPITAQNPVDAIELMDFFYEPDDRGRRWPSTSTTCPRCRPPRPRSSGDAAKATGDDKATLERWPPARWSSRPTRTTRSCTTT